MAGPLIHQSVVLENGTDVFMARIVDTANSNAVQATFATITYSVYLCGENYPKDRDDRTVVTNHEDVALTVASVMFDTLQTGQPWDTALDASGYNFKHEIDITTTQAFTIAGRTYVVQYTATPTGANPVRWDREVRVQ